MWQLGRGITLLRTAEDWRSAQPEVIEVDLATDPGWRLALLPGIGRGRAQRIVSARRDGDVPTALADLDAIPGIGPGTIARIQSTALVRVRVAGHPVDWAHERP